MPVGAENLIRCTDQGRCTRKSVGTCRATYVPHLVAPAVRQDPDGDLEILVSNPIGVFGTHMPDIQSRVEPGVSVPHRWTIVSDQARPPDSPLTHTYEVCITECICSMYTSRVLEEWR